MQRIKRKMQEEKNENEEMDIIGDAGRRANGRMKGMLINENWENKEEQRGIGKKRC